MTSVNEIVAGYVAAWNETDAGRRRDIIARTWAEDGRYLDAHREGTGYAAIDAMIAAAQQQFRDIGYGCRAGSRRIMAGCGSVGPQVERSRRRCLLRERILWSWRRMGDCVR